MLRLDRIKLFLLGFAVIMICYFVRQLTFITSSERTEGIVINVTNNDSKSRRYTRLSYPVVRFDAGGLSHVFTAESNLDVSEGDKVEVIYKKDEPGEARIYTFAGFWLRNIIWFIIPLVVWSAFSLSYLSKGELLSLHLWGAKEDKGSNGSAQLPHDWNENKRLEE